MKYSSRLLVATFVILWAANTSCAALAADGPPPSETAISVASGGVYANCAACHGAQGEGGFGPPLRANPRLGDAGYVVQRVLQGGGRMPAFGSQLNDVQIAAVVSAITSHWANQFKPVSPAEVARLRRGSTE
jgi:mono/diheme cytochrome c family protein